MQTKPIGNFCKLNSTSGTHCFKEHIETDGEVAVKDPVKGQVVTRSAAKGSNCR